MDRVELHDWNLKENPTWDDIDGKGTRFNPNKMYFSADCTKTIYGEEFSRVVIAGQSTLLSLLQTPEDIKNLLGFSYLSQEQALGGNPSDNSNLSWIEVAKIRPGHVADIYGRTTLTAIATGNWSDTTTWDVGGVIPDNTYDVAIAGAFDVTLTGASACKSINQSAGSIIGGSQVLSVGAGNCTITTTAGEVNVTRTGTGTDTFPIATTFVHDYVVNGSGITATFAAGSLSGIYTLTDGGLTQSGNMTVTGAASIAASKTHAVSTFRLDCNDTGATCFTSAGTVSFGSAGVIECDGKITVSGGTFASDIDYDLHAYRTTDAFLHSGGDFHAPNASGEFIVKFTSATSSTATFYTHTSTLTFASAGGANATWTGDVIWTNITTTVASSGSVVIGVCRITNDLNVNGGTYQSGNLTLGTDTNSGRIITSSTSLSPCQIPSTIGCYNATYPVLCSGLDWNWSRQYAIGCSLNGVTFAQAINTATGGMTYHPTVTMTGAVTCSSTLTVALGDTWAVAAQTLTTSAAFVNAGNTTFGAGGSHVCQSTLTNTGNYGTSSVAYTATTGTIVNNGTILMGQGSAFVASVSKSSAWGGTGSEWWNNCRISGYVINKEFKLPHNAHYKIMLQNCIVNQPLPQAIEAVNCVLRRGRQRIKSRVQPRVKA